MLTIQKIPEKWKKEKVKKKPVKKALRQVGRPRTFYTKPFPPIPTLIPLISKFPMLIIPLIHSHTHSLIATLLTHSSCVNLKPILLHNTKIPTNSSSSTQPHKHHQNHQDHPPNSDPIGKAHCIIRIAQMIQTHLLQCLEKSKTQNQIKWTSWCHHFLFRLVAIPQWSTKCDLMCRVRVFFPCFLSFVDIYFLCLVFLPLPRHFLSLPLFTQPTIQSGLSSFLERKDHIYIYIWQKLQVTKLAI